MPYVDALFDRDADKISIVERRDGKRIYQEYPVKYPTDLLVVEDPKITLYMLKNSK